MAINFTVSTFTFIEDPDASVMGLNMISGGSLTITPNEGFTVSASDFSAPGTLPGQFDSITFTDTAVAGEINNTVTVSFVFSILFEMSAELNTINVPFTGHARPVDNKRYIDFRIAFIDDTSVNLNGSSTVSTIGSTVTQSGPSGDPVVTTNLSASNVTAGFLVQIGTLVVTADDSPEICNFVNPPTIELVNMPDGTISLQLDSITRRDGETETVKVWNYKIMFVSEFSLTSNAQVIISYTGVVKKTAKEIKQIIVGSTDITEAGGLKKIKIYGDVDAEFDLTLFKNSDNTSIIDSGTANADVLDRNAGVIRGINKTLSGATDSSLFSTFEFSQNFPTITSNESYNLNIYPKNGTTLNSGITQPPSSQIVFNQYIRPTITINTNAGTNYAVTSATTIAYRGFANHNINQLKKARKLLPRYKFTYIYTKAGGATKFTTANVPVWSLTSTSSNWERTGDVDHGNIIEIVGITTKLSNTDTVATVTGYVLLKRFGTKNVTFTLDSSDFLSVDGAALTTP